MDIVKQLPQELKDYIWSYVDITVKVWTIKEYYEKYHNILILTTIPDFNKYMTYIIIKKHNYIFDIIYLEKKTHWQTPYFFKSIRFKTYDMYLKDKAETYNNNYVLNKIKNNNKLNLKKTQFKEKRKYLTWRK
jgi:hypothetical protein